MDTVERAVRFAMTELKVETLKDKQKEAICSFVNGRDCFVILPTGYGKTLCYVLFCYRTFLITFVERQGLRGVFGGGGGGGGSGHPPSISRMNTIKNDN